MKKLLILAPLLFSGCITKIKTPDGASYLNIGFTKTFSELALEKSSTNSYKVAVKNWKSDGAQATALAMEALKHIPVMVP